MVLKVRSLNTLLASANLLEKKCTNLLDFLFKVDYFSKFEDPGLEIPAEVSFSFLHQIV